MKKIISLAVISVLMSLGIATSSASAAPYCGITWGSTAKVSATTTTRALTNIRTGQHDCYDRMVVDLTGAASTGYDVRYVSNVHAEGSGAVVPLPNSGAKLQIVVRAPSYNIVSGAATYPGISGQALPGVNVAGYQTFKEAKFAGSFEGQTTIALGVRAQLPFRVTISDNHVIIDVAHAW